MPHMPLFRGRGLFTAVAVVAVCVLAARPASSQSVNLPYHASMTAAEIVDQIQSHNRSRSDALRHFKALRHYAVQYKGFATTLAAGMDVEVTYDASSGKSFRVVSQSGSKFLCEKVLQRAVDSEKEASADKGATALTSANYKFQLTGTDVIEGRLAYVLQVDPLTESKFLYRGKIWVDAADFAVVKIDAEPAKNPSIWISRTQIDYTSAKTGDFWLPSQNRSETKVRIGGTSVLTIDYGTYQVASNDPHCCVGTK